MTACPTASMAGIRFECHSTRGISVPDCTSGWGDCPPGEILNLVQNFLKRMHEITVLLIFDHNFAYD